MSFKHNCKQLLAAAALIASSFSAFAHEPVSESANLVSRTWYIVAMKCPSDMQLAGRDKFIQYYFSLQFRPSNNPNYGTYVRTSTDMDTDPRQEGKYAIRQDESGHLTLTLTDRRNQVSEYTFQAPNENHLTLSRLTVIARMRNAVYTML